MLLARPAGGWLASLATTPGAHPNPHTLSSTIKIRKIALFRFLASGDLGGRFEVAASNDLGGRIEKDLTMQIDEFCVARRRVED